MTRSWPEEAGKLWDGKVATRFSPFPFPTSGATLIQYWDQQRGRKWGWWPPKQLYMWCLPQPPTPAKNVQKKMEYSRLSDNSGFGKSGPAITKAFKVNILRVSYNITIFLRVNQTAIGKSWVYQLMLPSYLFHQNYYPVRLMLCFFSWSSFVSLCYSQHQGHTPH